MSKPGRPKHGSETTSAVKSTPAAALEKLSGTLTGALFCLLRLCLLHPYLLRRCLLFAGSFLSDDLLGSEKSADFLRGASDLPNRGAKPCRRHLELLRP